MKQLILLLCLLIYLGGCDSDSADIIEPTPTVEVTATPTPTPTTAPSQPANILTAVEEFMTTHGFASTNVEQVGETYMTTDYMMAVIRGTYSDGSNETAALHLAHLDFGDGGYRVVNMYPGKEDLTNGFYPNVVNLNGNMVIWSALHETFTSEQARLYYADGTYGEVALSGNSAVYRFNKGVSITKLVPLDTNGEEISALTFEGDALSPLANITHSMGARFHPMTGEIIDVCGYPTAPDLESKTALTDALQNAGLLQGRRDCEVIAAKEYSDRLYTAIAYTQNEETVYELVISDLTIEGEIDILGVCAFAAPNENGFHMYSAAIDNDIICWTLLNETRAHGAEQVLMDFNSFRFYWENGDSKDDLIVERFFIYTNRHVGLPTKCVPIVNGEELTSLNQTITRVQFNLLP